MRFNDILKEEKPRERLVKYGVERVSNEELLAIILKTGSKKYNVKEVASNILSSYGDIKNLKDVRINNLTKIDGIGKVKAIELIAAIELGRRVYYEEEYKDMITLTNPKVIIGYFNKLFKGENQECFYVVYLDSKNKYIDKKLVFKGILNKSLIHPRDIFKEAYLLSACNFICIHNHPSGDSKPSKNDIEITAKLYDAANMVGVELLDHLVIGNMEYTSIMGEIAKKLNN